MTPSSTIAIIAPPAKTPAPPNMRRTVTGPKTANSSVMYAGSSAPANGGGSECALERIPIRQNRNVFCTLAFAHVLFGKPVPTFPGHALVRLDGVALRRRQQHRFAAAAGRRLVRVVKHELRGKLFDLPIHLGADQE